MDAEALGASGAASECAVRIGDFTLRARCGDLGARGKVKIVARPERGALLAHGTAEESTVPGIVERTVYVGAKPLVIALLPVVAAGETACRITGLAVLFPRASPAGS